MKNNMKSKLFLLVLSVFISESPVLAQLELAKFPQRFDLDDVKKRPENLAKLLENKNVQFRREAIDTLYSLKSKAASAIPALTKALKDKDLEVRLVAASCFQLFEKREKNLEGAVPILTELILKDPDLNVRQSAAHSLHNLTKLDKNLTRNVSKVLLPALKEKDTIIRLNVAGTLGILGVEGQKPFQVMADLLGDENDDLQTQGIHALGEAGLPALPTLKACLKNKNPKIRSAVTGSYISMIKEVQRKQQNLPPEVIVFLMEALEDKDKSVVNGAIQGLAAVGPKAKEAIPKFIKLLEHSDPTVRYSAAEYIKDLGSDSKKAIPELVKALSDQDWRVRRAAVQTLGTFRDEPLKVIPCLIMALEDPESCAWAAESLAEFGPQAADALPHLAKLLLNANSWVTRETAAKVLNSFGPASKQAIPALEQAVLSDNYNLVRTAVALTLSSFRDDD